MTALGRATEEIGKIVDMINAITNQTNMLGLNASIEAARAGEYGKGFAVVAKSIKELSDKSKNATDGISKLIIDIQNRINEAVDKSKEGLVELKSGINLVQASGTSIENIIEVVNKTYEYSNSITESTKLQNESSKGIAKYMDELHENISEIASTTMQESSGMQEITAGIETIKENVDELASGIKEINELSQYIVDNSNKLKSNLEK
ncbi:methyl-accepting chemotaxis protein [Clostridium neuense]|uniref:Methyl-accepting chemotaxis protein n=1 Tax=Clostridium neuense TaxID=1728934 RepID=A0ABW8TMF2_9CLOT